MECHRLRWCCSCSLLQPNALVLIQRCEVAGDIVAMRSLRELHLHVWILLLLLLHVATVI